MQDMIAEFDALVGPKSLLGKELRALQKERDKQALAFESAPEKMAYDTSPYRRSNMAIEHFLREWLPKVRKARENLTVECQERLIAHEKAVLSWEYGTKTPMDRRSETRVWMHFALEKYRGVRPAVRKAKMYHPQLVVDILAAWRTFRHELRIWKYGHMPFDGSQAMSEMFNFFLKLDLLAAVND